MTIANKYVGFDVHKVTIAATVRNESGRVTQRQLLETKAEAVISFLRGIGPGVWLAFEEGTQAEWLCEIASPYVERVVVANVRGRDGKSSKNDRLDADELSDLLRVGRLRGVFHGSSAQKQLKELVRNYGWLVNDTVRIKLRIQAAYRSRGITTGREVYSEAQRNEWLERIDRPALRMRLEMLYTVLDALIPQRKKAKQAMIEEARRHPAWKILCQIKFLGPVRISQILGIVGTPNRFRSRRPFWSYVGLAVVTRDTAQHTVRDGQFERRNRRALTRGLNPNYNRVLKNVFKGAAQDAASRPGPFVEFYQGLIARGMRPEMAKLTLARKIAAVVLRLWKTGERFDPKKLSLKSS